jgi:hypothetical protein
MQAGGAVRARVTLIVRDPVRRAMDSSASFVRISFNVPGTNLASNWGNLGSAWGCAGSAGNAIWSL